MRRLFPFILVLPLVFWLGSAQAQGCPRLLNSDDCATLNETLDTINSAEAVTLSFEYVNAVNMTNLASQENSVIGEGYVELNDEGQVIAADFGFRGRIDMSMMGSGGAQETYAKFILYDGWVYVGMGESLADIHWVGAPISDVPNYEAWNLRLDTVYPTEILRPFYDPDSWQIAQEFETQDGGFVRSYGFEYRDNNPMATSFSLLGSLAGGAAAADAGGDTEMGALFGGMMGGAMAESMGFQGEALFAGAVAADLTRDVPYAVLSSRQFVIDVGSQFGSDPFLDALIGTQGGMSEVLEIYFIDFNEYYWILPPTEFGRMTDSQLASLSVGGRIGFTQMMAFFYLPYLLDQSAFMEVAQAAPTITPGPTATEGPSPTPSDTPTPTITFTPSATFTASATFTPSNTPTATFTPTITPTPTSTPTFTPTFTPTITPTPTQTLIPCTVSASSSINLRSGPGTGFDIRGTLPAGQEQLINAQDTGSDGFVWWRLPDGTWVRSDTVSETGQCEELPIASEAAAPTLEATPIIECNLTTRFGVNLRTEPDPRAPQLGSRQAGDTFAADAQSTGPEGFVWWRVGDGSIDDGLWVREDLVTEAGACSSLPGPGADDTTPGGVLAPGVEAIVNTTAGDTLNLRTGPGTLFDILERLSDGDRVTVLEGPLTVDPFVWWRVRSASGREGWVVEAADGIITLIPLE